MPRLNNTAARWIGQRIVLISRWLLAKCYGLRQPAARIHLHDLDVDREFIIYRLIDALHADRPTDIKYWTEQLGVTDDQITRAEQHAKELANHRPPTPSQTMPSALNVPTRRGSSEVA